jgi:transcriptional regulator with XRE-family HTH domain
MEVERSPQTSFMLGALKSALRDSGWTSARISKELQVSLATVKRWLLGQGLTLARLEALAGLAGITLAELADSGHHASHALSQQLTLAQESALSKDSILSLLFIVLLAGEGFDEFEHDFDLPEGTVQPLLSRLEKLALIDLLPGRNVRVKVDRSVLWRKTPLRQRFETEVKPQFFAMDFANPRAVYASELVKLSDAGAARVAEMIERHRRELQDLALKDRREAVLPRTWHVVLFASRPLDESRLPRPIGKAGQ